MITKLINIAKLATWVWGLLELIRLRVYGRVSLRFKDIFSYELNYLQNFIIVPWYNVKIWRKMDTSVERYFLTKHLLSDT
jgi:hypothetical protein